MSLARYLSKLGALLNSSGQVPAAGLAPGAVTNGAIADNSIGLAKLAREGSAGQVLTSNGAGSDPSYQALPAGGVTSLNGQTGAITNTNRGAIGSYLIAASTSSGTTAYAADATIAGSSLITASATGGFTGALPLANGAGISSGGFSSAGVSGTWRTLQAVGSGTQIYADSSYRTVSIWVRIS